MLGDPIHLGIPRGNHLGGLQIGGGHQFGFLDLAGADHIEYRGLAADRLDGLGQHHDIFGCGTGRQGVDARLDRIDLGLEWGRNGHKKSSQRSRLSNWFNCRRRMRRSTSVLTSSSASATAVVVAVSAVCT